MSDVQQLAGQRVLLTGASGFIGAQLCAALLQAGAVVHALSRRVQPAQLNGPQWWQGDLADLGQLRSLFNVIQPDIVFHLASYVSGSRDLAAVLPTFQSNLLSTVHLLTLAAEQGCRRVVLAGSLEEPQPSGSEPIPASPYAAAKGASSAYARMFHALYQTPVVIARLFMVYGPGQRDLHKLVPYVTLALLRGEAPRLSSGTRPIDWIYIDDVVAGLLAAALTPGLEGSTVELGSGTMATVRTVVEQLQQITGATVQPIFGGVADRPFEQVRLANVAASYAQMGWQPRIDLQAGLQQTVAWYAQQLRMGHLEAYER